MSDWIQQNFPDIYRIGMQGANSWPDAIYATLLYDCDFLHHWWASRSHYGSLLSIDRSSRCH